MEAAKRRQRVARGSLRSPLAIIFRPLRGLGYCLLVLSWTLQIYTSHAANPWLFSDRRGLHTFLHFPIETNYQAQQVFCGQQMPEPKSRRRELKMNQAPQRGA
jgi:hypothetical protein